MSPMVHGTQHHSAKLNATKVRAARRSYGTGKVTLTALAIKYGVSIPSISDAVYGKSWKHVT